MNLPLLESHISSYLSYPLALCQGGFNASHSYQTLNSVRVGTLSDIFNAMSLVSETKYMLQKYWLRYIFSFAAAQDADMNEE